MAKTITSKLFVLIVMALVVLSVSVVGLTNQAHAAMSEAAVNACLGSGGVVVDHAGNDMGLKPGDNPNPLQLAAANNCETPSSARSLFGIGGIFETVIYALIFITGAVSVLFIVIGGVRYVLSSGDSAQIQGARDTILYAVRWSFGRLPLTIRWSLAHLVIRRQ